MSHFVTAFRSSSEPTCGFQKSEGALPMVRHARNLFCAGLIVFANIFIAWVSPVQAQVSTATNTVIAIGPPTQGIVQAGDGNFYAPSQKFFEACQSNSSQNCAFIYKVTPSGTMTPFHAFQPVSNT